MNVNPFRSIAAQFSQLSIGISRTCIRLNHTGKRRRKTPIPPNFEPDHGEQIWVFNNFLNGMTVYSHEPVLKANKALRQIPYNGKKLKPAKLRKDFWRQMAMIQFPEGLGHIGRSVYHIMRELRMVHELEWGDDFFFDEETGKTLTRQQRGAKLNDQKPNAIADIAAVLAGAGKGNKMWTSGENGEDAELATATVFWRDDMDRNYAAKWSPNVIHARFAESGYVMDALEEVEAADQAAENEGAKAVAEEGENNQTAPPELLKKEKMQRTEQTKNV